MAGRQRDELFAPASKNGSDADQERVGSLLDEGCKGRVDFAFGAGIENNELLPERRAPLPARLPWSTSAFGLSGFTSTPIVAAAGTSSLQQLQPLCHRQRPTRKLTPVTLPPGRLRLATRPAPTGSLPVTKTIGNRRRSRPWQRGCERSPPIATMTVDTAADQIGRQRRQSINLIIRPAIFDRDVLRPRHSRLRSSLGGIRPRWSRRVPSGTLLRNPITGIAGCCARAASGHAAAAPPSSVMNSRRCIIRSPRRRGRAACGGISRPSALAVLRLITISNLVGACTGRSAGFSPLRMRST